ncbi:MAG: universal stress protein [Terriglobia bacterium]
MLKIEQILCPVDFSEVSKKAFEYAVSLAQRYKAKLYVQHSIEPVTVFSYESFPGWSEMYEILKSGAETSMSELMSLPGSQAVHPEPSILVGTPSESILNFAEKKSIDLIVMGSHGRRGMDRFVMGSVTDRVLRKAKCPVLAVRKPAHDFIKPGSEDAVQLRKITLGTDFSDHALRAFDYALSLAMEYQAELTLVHVLEDIPHDKELQPEIDRLTREMEAAIPADASNWCTVKTVVRIGKPYQEIIQLATESQADLIVLGIRGRNALDIALFGSTTHRVLQLGPCPVLTVRTQ